MSRIVRHLNLDEVQTLLDWAGREGWNPGLDDAAAFLAADPTGFFGAFVGDAMVAGISAVAYDQAFGFIGLYICHPDWRGQGHGKAVWDAATAYLGKRAIGLDGVPQQQANYASMGFVIAYGSVRMAGTLTASSEAAMPPAGTVLNVISALDAACFPAARPDFLRHWTSPPRTLIVVERDGATAGYAVIRPCLDGSKIGPLFATDIDAALDILARVHGRIQIDVPMAQTAWLTALAARGFLASFETARMYRGAVPYIAMAQIFGITSLELG